MGALSRFWRCRSAGGSCRLAARQRVADLAEVVSQEAEADPSFHPGFAVVTAAVQSKSPFQHTDAALDARPPAVRPSKSGTLLDLLLFGRQRSLTWYGDRADVEIACELLVLERGEGAVGGEHIWSTRERRLVMSHAVGELWRLGWIADQHHVACDQAAIHFVQDDFATELSRYVSFATPHDRCVRFEQTHQLGGGRHTFAVQHTPLGLRDDLLDQRHHVLDG